MWLVSWAQGCLPRARLDSAAARWCAKGRGTRHVPHHGTTEDQPGPLSSPAPLQAPHGVPHSQCSELGEKPSLESPGREGTRTLRRRYG